MLSGENETETGSITMLDAERRIAALPIETKPMPVSVELKALLMELVQTSHTLRRCAEAVQMQVDKLKSLD